MAAPTPTQTKKKVSLKLLVNKETNKVLFAEAGKDFVDVLCSFLTLPLGTIARLVEKDSNKGPVTVGCLNSLYHSVADLDKECFWKETSKEMLLQPTNSSEDYCNSLELNIDDTEPTKYFTCSKLDVCHSPRISTSSNSSACQYCRGDLTRSVIFKHFGFFNSVASYTITDDLIVMPNSMNYTSVGLLQNFGIQSTKSVKELVVVVTSEKVLDLLKCALISKSPLTDLFFGKKPSLERLTFVSCDVKLMSNTSISFMLKLFIRNTDGKILFAQGEEDFADFILSFLTFPLGGVARLVRQLGGNCSFGSIDGLYKSIADIDEKRYMLSKAAKDRLLSPHLAPQFKVSKILPIQQPSQSFYCHTINNEFFINRESRSTNCKTMLLVNSNSSIGSYEVYVKSPRTYVVTDELVFSPTSPISALGLINDLGTPLKDIKEKVVTIGYKECLNILKASLTSTSALTNGLCHLLTEVEKEK